MVRTLLLEHLALASRFPILRGALKSSRSRKLGSWRYEFNYITTEVQFLNCVHVYFKGLSSSGLDEFSFALLA